MSGTIDGSSLLAVYFARRALGAIAQKADAASLRARESMMLRPGSVDSPAAYFSADYDRYKNFARLKAMRQQGAEE